MDQKSSKPSPQTLLADARAYLDAWLSMKGIQITRENRQSTLSSLVLDYDEQYRMLDPNQRKPRYIAKHLWDAAIDEQIVRIEEKKLSDLRASLKCTNENLEPLKDFLSLTIGDYTDLSLYAVAHWLWSVKRKLNDVTVVDPIALVFFGPQGTGKSLLCETISRPFRHLKINASALTLADERTRMAVERHYIWQIDELSGADRADIDEIKRIITEARVSARPMRTNDMVLVKQNCSFIITSNQRTNEKLYDVTGMRRFVEIDVVRLGDVQSILNSDIIKIWQGIDEGRDHGYLNVVKSELVAHQENMTPEDPINTFLAESNLVPPRPNQKTKFISSSAVFSSYRVFCEKRNERAMTQGRFSSVLKNRGFPQTKRWTEENGKKTQQRGFEVADQPIHLTESAFLETL